MRVLFVPLPGILSHTIPLLALDRKLKGSRIETAFLAPQSVHHVLKLHDANVLPIDHRGTAQHALRSEMGAYGTFSPDVVVDDASLSTGFATALKGVTRVAIQRTGFFPGSAPGKKNHRLSMSVPRPQDLPDVTFLGLSQPRSYTDFFNADFKIVPGIKSIEVLPPDLRDDPTYTFSGPLLVDDYMIPTTLAALLDSKQFRDFRGLENFFDAHKNLKIVYLTFGTTERATELVFACIRFLLDNNVAVVTSVDVQDLTAEQRKLYYFAQYLPMHLVSSHVDLMVHQCGCGTYHYPLLHSVPVITIGTQCYDREEVAVRLEELGVSTHIPSPAECDDFVERFKRTVAECLAESGARLQERRECLSRLKNEIEQTTAAFDFERFLDRAAGAPKGRGRAGGL